MRSYQLALALSPGGLFTTCVVEHAIQSSRVYKVWSLLSDFTILDL